MDKRNFLHNHPDTERRLGLDENHVIVDKDDWEYARKQGLNLYIPDVSGSLHFFANDVDGAYLLGVFNTTGLDGLAKEIARLKELKMNPSTMLELLKRAEQ